MLMPSYMLLPYLVLWAALMRALCLRAGLLPTSCNRCGLGYERRELGEPICSCGSAR